MARPHLKVNVGLGLAVVVWKNSGKNGSTYYSLDFERRFKGKDGKYETANRGFFLGDAIALARGLDHVIDSLLTEQSTEQMLAAETRDDGDSGDERTPF